MTRTATTTDFRYGLADRLGIGATTALLWFLLLFMAAMSAMVLFDKEWTAALVLAVTVLFFLQLANIVARDCRMKWGWRITLGTQEAWLRLPAGRLLFGAVPSENRSVLYREISHLETRTEAISTFGMTTLNTLYAARLKSGELILLGEDRPIPRTGLWTSLAGDAAKALARAANVTMKRFPAAEGSGGFLTLWGTSRPPWPKTAEGGLSEAEENKLRRRLMMTNLIPSIAFAVALAACAIANLGR